MTRAAASSVAALIAAVTGGAVADAQAAASYEDAAAAAVRVDASGLGSLLWSALIDCESRADDLLRRQCRGLRATRARAAASQTFVMRAALGAVWVGEEAGEGGVPFGLRGCLACVAPLDLGDAGGGAPRYVVTRGSVLVSKGNVVGPDLFHGVRPRAPRLVAELVFRLAPPGPSASFTQDGKAGLFVEPVAYRLWDACDGAILAASPAARAGAAEIDAVACGGTLAARRPATAVDDRPEQLSAAQIRAAMADVAAGTERCFESYGVPGTADVYFDLAGDGQVKYAEVRGELADTPTSRCVVAAVKKAQFPPFKRSHMQIHYPFILR